MTFQGKTVFITGASRGIGKTIALHLAKEGANIIVAAKTAQAHPKLAGTIYTAAEEIEKAGGKALPVITDIRKEENVKEAVAKAVETFGGIDILINNASAIQLTGTLHTEMKRFDLMHQVNMRGTYMTSKICLPYLLKAENPHVLNISPPLNIEERWFAPHVAYTMAKYGMSLCVLGMAGEFRKKGVAFNALWPKTAIATAAVEMLGGEKMMKQSRKPEIMADAAHIILSKKSTEFTGNFLIDEEILKAHGITDMEQYANVPGEKLIPDFFV